MKRPIGIGIVCLLLSLFAQAQESIVKLKIVQTSDIHGSYYSYDFINRQPKKGSLASIYSYVRQQRVEYGDRLLLLDNGDILQGQPTAYYYNYIDTVAPHLCAEMMNYMGYDAGNMGNHDVETGRSVFDRWVGACNFPILGANIIDTTTCMPHLPPYKVMVRDGVKIVVLGMITPAIPAWLPESLWRGLRFDDMEETATRWMQIIREREQPDVVIGLFHAGQNSFRMMDKYNENAAADVARRVPGFDIVLMGHDHIRECRQVTNIVGDSVWLLNPANNGRLVAEIDITLKLLRGKVTGKQLQGKLVEADAYEPDGEFVQWFSSQYDEVERFVSRKIGRLSESIFARSALFGPSAFVDLIHELQLENTGAEISLVAPLSLDAEVEEGDIHVGDLFNLYRYENQLYVMALSGQEVKSVLEMSYNLWTNRMQTAKDHLLRLEEKMENGKTVQAVLRNPSFNFDSAAGIIYTVDVTKPAGHKIAIVSMADGTPFSLQKEYRVAMSSYRGNGGGELLTKGAGISPVQLKKRLLSSTEHDLRYFLMQYIVKREVINPKSLNQWRFVPEEWTLPAARRDSVSLFGKE